MAIDKTTKRILTSDVADVDWSQDAAWIIDDLTFIFMEKGLDYEEAAERADIYVMRRLSQDAIDRRPPRP